MRLRDLSLDEAMTYCADVSPSYIRVSFSYIDRTGSRPKRVRRSRLAGDFHNALVGNGSCGVPLPPDDVPVSFISFAIHNKHGDCGGKNGDAIDVLCDDISFGDLMAAMERHWTFRAYNKKKVSVCE